MLEEERLAGQQNNVCPVWEFGFDKVANRTAAFVVVRAEVWHFSGCQRAVERDHGQFRILNFIYRAGYRVDIVRRNNKALCATSYGVFRVSDLFWRATLPVQTCKFTPISFAAFTAVRCM